MRLAQRTIGRQRGFTLIELMTVVIIVAVLLAIALPAYQNQVTRTYRASAISEMLEIANRQEQFLLSNRSYTNDANDISYDLPSDLTDFYTFTISTVSASAAPEFTIRFSPISGSRQDGDGWLQLDEQGSKTAQGGAEKWER